MIAVQLLHEAEYGIDELGHQPHRYLVDQRQLRAGDECPRDGELLLLAAGKRLAGLVFPFGKHRKERVKPCNSSSTGSFLRTP